MAEVRAELHPSKAVHWMPDNSHTASINCWCHPVVKNIGQAATGTTVEHTRYAGDRFMASRTN